MTRKEFRRWALVGVVLVFAGTVMEFTAEKWLPRDQQVLLEWNFYGALLPYELLVGLYWTGLAFYWLGLVGFLLFQPIGRSLFLVGTCMWVLPAPLVGWVFYVPVWSGLAEIGWTILLAMLALSYFPPHSALFGDPQ